MKYMKQLDAIRAIGVSVVLYQHFWGFGVKPLTFFGHTILFGVTAVDSFFVLSGFLITGILLKSKARVERGEETVPGSLKSFYVRRTLRIFPVFYLTLLIAFLIEIAPVPQTIWWHVFYASNIYEAVTGSVDNGAISHLWSLAVEEQFYLVWPLVILLVPKEHLKKVLVAIILTAPAFRQLCFHFQTNNAVPSVITMGNLDLLGLGGLLAYLKAFQPEKLKPFLKTSLIIGFPMFFVAAVSGGVPYLGFLRAFARTFEGMGILWFLNGASEGFRGWLGFVLELKPLSYLGKISYGLYVCHNFVPWALAKVLSPLGLAMPASLAVQFLLYSALSVLLASASWHFFESRIMKIKDLYEPRPVQRSQKVVAQGVDSR